MPRKTSALTVKEIDALRWDGSDRKLTDGRTPGLQLFLKSTGKTWRLKHRFAGREKLVTLGHYPAMGLADARQAAGEKRALLARGIDPVADRREKEAASRAAQETTEGSFEAVAREWVEQVHRHRVVPSHAERNLRRLERHVFPSLGKVRLAAITPGRLLAVLREVERTGHVETAHRLRTLSGQVFRYGIVTGRAERDVAADLRDALKTAEIKHHAALTDPADLAHLLRAIQALRRAAGDYGSPATRPTPFCAPRRVADGEVGRVRSARRHLELPTKQRGRAHGDTATKSGDRDPAATERSHRQPRWLCLPVHAGQGPTAVREHAECRAARPGLRGHDDGAWVPGSSQDRLGGAP
jgi:hypothetical protein